MNLSVLRRAVLCGGAGVLLASGMSAFPDITNTRHNLGERADTTTEVCVFCHTPHGANATAAVPLWNKTLGVGSYLPSIGTEGIAVTPGSVTIACLACHDGAQATDTLINAPGSGRYNPSGARFEPGNNQFEPLTGNDVICQPGQACEGHHPISVQYGGGGPVETDPDGLFTGALGLGGFGIPVKDTTANNQPIWWVDSNLGTSGIREKTDMILYTRDDLGVRQPFVECASCHDPHTDEVNRFLRNDEDQVCVTCHVM